MKKLLLFILVITGLCFLGACTQPLLYVAGQLEPKLEEGWSHTAYLNQLMKNSKKQLLTEEEKLKAAKNICALKHLDKRKKINYEEAKVFCTLELDDEIYFYDNCKGCSSAIDSEGTSYLLVRDKKPFEAVQIERKYSKELGKSVPIVERLH